MLTQYIPDELKKAQFEEGFVQDCINMFVIHVFACIGLTFNKIVFMPRKMFVATKIVEQFLLIWYIFAVMYVYFRYMRWDTACKT
jgi:hypothetical protein